MINCNKPISISTEICEVFKDADNEMKRIAQCLINNQVKTVRDLIRLTDIDLMLLTNISRACLTEIEDVLRQNDMHLNMDFYEMEQLKDIENVDKVAEKAVVRREKELFLDGCSESYAHDQAQDELRNGSLKFNDEEMTEWISLGFGFIDEELALRKVWKEKMDAVRKTASIRASKSKDSKDEGRFSMRSIRRYVFYLCGRRMAE